MIMLRQLVEAPLVMDLIPVISRLYFSGQVALTVQPTRPVVLWCFTCWELSGLPACIKSTLLYLGSFCVNLSCCSCTLPLMVQRDST